MKKILCILVFIIITFHLSICTGAINTSFKTVDISSKKQLERATRLNLQKVEKEVMGESIKNFDINEKYVAICLSSPQAINIYSFSGRFVCSFTFKVNTGEYWVELNKADLEEFNLYTVRDGDLFCYDFSGKFLGATEVDTSAVESTDASSYLHLEKEKSNEHGTYKLSSELGKGKIKFINEDSILTLADKQGKETIIYNINDSFIQKNEIIKQNHFFHFIPTIFCSIIVMTISIIIFIFIKKNR